MLDQIFAYLMGVLSFLSQLPGVGKYVAIIIAVAMGLSGAATSLVMAWHGIVMLIQGLSMIPGLSALSALSASLKSSDDALTDFVNNKLLGILNRLSALPLPKLPSP